MPLIVIVGLPSSGKTKRANEIKDHFVINHGKTVHVVSENVMLRRKSIDKNRFVFDAQKEKEIRGVLKSEALRLLEKDNVVILDSGNYIKGYRYELYCATKQTKTTQLTFESLASKEDCWSWNLKRDEHEIYTREAFDALYLRHEAPDSRNRWDSPLISLQSEDVLQGQEIYKYLFLSKPPPPNLSTENQPLSSSDFLYELDRITQDVVKAILSAIKLGNDGADVLLPGFDDCVLEDLPNNLTPVQLAKHRRQFLNYMKLHPPSCQNDTPMKLAKLFVQFLNTSLSR